MNVGSMDDGPGNSVIPAGLGDNIMEKKKYYDSQLKTWLKDWTLNVKNALEY